MHNVCFLGLVTPEKIYNLLITTCSECCRLPRVVSVAGYRLFFLYVVGCRLLSVFVE